MPLDRLLAPKQKTLIRYAYNLMEAYKKRTNLWWLKDWLVTSLMLLQELEGNL